MWLHLDVNGIDFHFKISRYKKSTQENWDDEWCKVDLTLQSGGRLNYAISSNILLFYEIEQLRDKLMELLSNKITLQQEIEFLEPDLSFILNSQKDLRLDPRYTYVSPGHEIVDINADICVHLWNGSMTSSRIATIYTSLFSTSLR